MSAIVKSAENIMALREGIFRLSEADRDRIATILYTMEPSVRQNFSNVNNTGINLEKLSDTTFSVLRELVNECLLQMRKALEINDLGRDLMKLPGKSPSKFPTVFLKPLIRLQLIDFC